MANKFQKYCVRVQYLQAMLTQVIEVISNNEDNAVKSAFQSISNVYGSKMVKKFKLIEVKLCKNQ